MVECTYRSCARIHGENRRAKKKTLVGIILTFINFVFSGKTLQRCTWVAALARQVPRGAEIL